MENWTAVMEFILMGCTSSPQLQPLLFVVLLLTYILTIAGNIIIIIVTLVDHRLQAPMYFFLRNFSILEISFTSAVSPKALAILASNRRTISLPACFTQTFFYFMLGTTESFLLAAMSFDRYVAICNPLRYTTIMNSQVRTLLVLGSWIGGFFLIIGPAVLLFQMPFCGPNIIDHFFCDNTPLLKLACANTRLLESMSFVVAVFSLLGCFTVTVVSYISIVTTVMQMPSTTRRQKAFSTCASHLIVVSITYGSCIFMYVRPTKDSKLDVSKGVSVLNTMVSPLLNPFIYSLRNKQVQVAIQDLFGKSGVFPKEPKLIRLSPLSLFQT
ncbi:olfactory receptor 6C75-like [Alligator mississippiensis]|uniref:Olfactory receptor n=1 Tax=Alligator mississippiensis TaxID=8496 RepID=A0A151MUI0_ALLMI|nr:olfactory receptor 6C75-like [Alligator mississippiensis]